MTAIYVNGLNLQMNELPIIQFNLNTQNGLEPVVTVAMTYEVLEQMHGAMGEALMQRKMKLHQVQSGDMTKAN